MIPEGILDTAPVPPPGLARMPAGKPVQFSELVRLAHMPDVVSTNTPPLITVHAGERDFRVPYPGRQIYCIGGATLPALAEPRAREILRRLAYGFLDWAARETVSRYHRDLKRAKPEQTRSDGLPAAVRIRRLVRGNPGITVGEISRQTGIAQPNVSRALAYLHSNGEIVINREGRRAYCSVAEARELEDISPRPQKM